MEVVVCAGEVNSEYCGDLDSDISSPSLRAGNSCADHVSFLCNAEAAGLGAPRL